MTQDDDARLVEESGTADAPEIVTPGSDESETPKAEEARTGGWIRKRRGRRWLLLVLLPIIVGGLAAGTITGYAPIDKVPSAIAQATRLPGALADLLPSSPLSAQGGADDCVRCHNAQSTGALMYVAVDGVFPPPAGPVRLKAGDTFNVAFHFTNMLGDPKRFRSVGAEIVVPDKLPWRVIPGTRTRPKDWIPTGSGPAFWSPAWDNGGNADGPQYLQWTSSKEAPGRYYLSLQGVPFAVSDTTAHGGVLADRGPDDPADRDGVPNHAGLTTTIEIPAATPAGTYSVTLYGVGHNKDGQRANISKSIQVEVQAGSGQSTRRSTQPGAGASPVPGSAFVPGGQSDGSLSSSATGAQGGPGGASTASTLGTDLYKMNCARCHLKPQKDLLSKGPDEATRITIEGTLKSGGTMPPQGKSAGGKLSDEEIGRIMDYVRVTLLYPGGTTQKVQHGLDGREGKCDLCHGPDGIKPKPKAHTSDNGACTLCHRFPPKIPHSTVGREVCDACHIVPQKPEKPQRSQSAQ